MAKAIDPHKSARQRAKKNVMPGSVVRLIAEMRGYMNPVEFNAWVDANIGKWEPWEQIEAKMRKELKEHGKQQN